MPSSPSLQLPDPAAREPVAGHPRVAFLKSVVDRPNVVVGDYSYYDDPDGPERFLERCVLHHYDFVGDRLVIGRYTAIAAGVTFLMNGANHALSGFSTYPFPIFGGAFAEKAPADLFADTSRGDTIVGNDVWIGHGATILPGIAIGDGAVIGAKAVVASDIPPYAIVAGNPARVVRRRFPDTVINRLLILAWWNRPAEWVAANLGLILGSDIDALERAAGDSA